MSSSASRVRRSTGGGGGGGKLLRGRRQPPSASPYLRPAPNCEDPPPPGGESGSATWISGAFTGAVKLLSSLFKSDSPSASSSYSYSTDGGSDEDEMDVSSKEHDPAEQIKKKLEPVKDCKGTSLAIISEIDSKHAIEQLVMQETFSRDEGNKLIKIIESRVLGIGDGVPKGLEKTTCNAVASHQTWKSLNLSRKLPESISCFSSSLNAISPRSSAFQVLTPELRHSAVREAKKWFEDKKLASSSKLDFDCRPCTLNTKMHQYDFGVEEGSPVDVAKSYVRSLSPWKSPSLSSIQFEKSPCTEMHLYKDEAPSATTNYSLPSSKGLKRNHHAFGSQDTVDEIRRVRLKSTVDELDNSKFKPIDLSKRYSTDEACKISSVEAELIQHNSSKLPASESYVSADYSVECARDYCSVGALGEPGKITEGTCPVRPDDTSPPVLISDTEEVVNTVQTTHITSSPITLPSKHNSSPGISPQFCDSTVPISDDNQKHVEAPCQVKEQLDSLSDPCTTLTPAPKSVEHPGDHSGTLLNSKSQKVPPVDFNSTQSDVEAGTRLDDVNASSIQLSCGVENNSLHQKLISCVKEIPSVADSTQQERVGLIQDEATQQDPNDRKQNKAKGLKISTDGSSAGLNTNVIVVPSEEVKATNNISNGEEAITGISERTSELPSSNTDSTDIPAPKITTSSVRAQSVSRGGTRMKSVKDVLTESQPSTSRGRGRKSGTGGRKGRGKPMAPVDAGS